MLFAQITDMHITDETPSPFAGRCPIKQLHNIIQHLNHYSDPIDFVLLTGDCVHHGSEHNYDLLQKTLSALKLPYFMIPGNHDDRTTMRKVFSNISEISEDPHFIHYTIEKYPLRLIGIDSVCDGQIWGDLCDKRLAWLDKTLNADRRKPTLLFMHHPPIRSGLPILDDYGYPKQDLLADVLRNHPQVKHILCGHFHRPIQYLWHHISVSIVGSSVAQFPTEFNPIKKWSNEPPAFALHRWNNGLMTQFCSIPLTSSY